MFILNSSMRTRLDEANEKALTPICSVHVQKIFALLHAKAVQAAEKKGVKIENTAADGNDPKNAVFHSAGEHMIVARSKEEGKKIKKDVAIAGIEEYVKVFCGEDVAKSLKKDEYFPLKNDEAGTEVSEAVAGDHIFFRYLAESLNLRYLAEAGDKKNADDAEDIDLDDGDDYLDTDYGHDDAAEDATGAENDGEEGDEDDSDDENKEGDSEDDTEEGDGAENGEENPSDIEEADAFYILYGLKIKGLKETTVSDALKQWGSNFLKGFGVKIDSLWGPGGSGNVHTVAGLMKNMRGLFGAIDDPDELCRRVQDQLDQKYPNVSKIDCQFRDKKTLIRELNKRHAKQNYIEGWPDGKNMQKINSADYSMYIHVEGDSLKQPYINRKVIANLVTMQIKGLFKKFKNMIKADDVIYISGTPLAGDEKEYGRIAMATIPSYLKIQSEFYDNNNKFTSNTIKSMEKANQLFRKALNNQKIKDNEDATKLIKLWQDFYQNHQDGRYTKKQLNDEFLEPYRIKYNEFQTKYKVDSDDVSESVYTAYDIIRDLFETQVDGDQLTDIYEQPPEYLVLAEDDKDGSEPLSDDQKSKVKGPVIDKIFKIADETIKAGKAKINFAPKMAKFARIDIDVCSNIENSEAAQYNLIEPVLEKVKKSEHPYFIMAYFKIPKEIENSQIKNKGKKDVNEAEFFDETEFLDEADNKTIQYLKKSGLSKEDALKDEEIEKIRQTYSNPPSVDEVKRKIEKYFEKHGGKVPAKAGFTWKGTPGQEGFTEENIKKAFQLAVDGEVYEFQRYTREAASDKFKYYDTDVPADVDVFFALADKLNGIDPQPSNSEKKKIYFAVSEDLENPDATKIQKFLNGEQSVDKSEITDEFLEKIQKEAQEYVSTLNESVVFEDETESDSKKTGWIFEIWQPDPKNPLDDPNGKGPDGKDAIVICAKFKKTGDSSSDLPIYFAVSKNLEEPDTKKIQKFLNDEKSVSQDDITNEFLEKMQEEAEEYVNQLNESILLEDEEGEEGEEGEEDEENNGKYSFVLWTPNPKNPIDYKGDKGPNGEDAIIICAKFKQNKNPNPPDPLDPEVNPGENKDKGDDLYIIPMPGVTYSDIDDEGFTKTM